MSIVDEAFQQQQKESESNEQSKGMPSSIEVPSQINSMSALQEEDDVMQKYFIKKDRSIPYSDNEAFQAVGATRKM